MSVLPPDMPRLRTLVTYLRGELGRAERALNAAEAAEEAAARRRPPKEPPAWLVEREIGAGRPPGRVHVGTCWDTGKRCAPATADQIRDLLAQGPRRPRLPPMPPRHRTRSAGMTTSQQGGGMSPAPRIIVYPPDAQGGRRVRCDGEILGRALGPADLFEFLRRAGLDPDNVDLDDTRLIEWRGGGPTVWSPEPGEE